jgi:hypothetical protein
VDCIVHPEAFVPHACSGPLSLQQNARWTSGVPTEPHAPPECCASVNGVRPAAQLYAAALRLDGPTLANLELLENSTGESAGSLLSRLDTCACAGGAIPVSRNICCLLLNGSHLCLVSIQWVRRSCAQTALAWLASSNWNTLRKAPVTWADGGFALCDGQAGGGCCGGGCAGRSPMCAPLAPARTLWTCSSRRLSWWAYRFSIISKPNLPVCRDMMPSFPLLKGAAVFACLAGEFVVKQAPPQVL